MRKGLARFRSNVNWENHMHQWPLKDQSLILKSGRTFFPTSYTNRKNPERFLLVSSFFPTLLLPLCASLSFHLAVNLPPPATKNLRD